MYDTASRGRGTVAHEIQRRAHATPDVSDVNWRPRSFSLFECEETISDASSSRFCTQGYNRISFLPQRLSSHTRPIPSNTHAAATVGFSALVRNEHVRILRRLGTQFSCLCVFLVCPVHLKVPAFDGSASTLWSVPPTHTPEYTRKTNQKNPSIEPEFGLCRPVLRGRACVVNL